MWSMWVIGRLEKYYKNAENFDPDRWFEPGVRHEVFIPFLYGPRTCLGQQMVSGISGCM